ncbi:MAG: ATP-binding cassette domain-containing protein [Deltaproteobacteria bacterium]|nr:ATP-binding cassette domain-containing protein [Deltaproteobacteria bacterium]
MTLISLRHISLAFGGPPLLEDVSLQIKEGERIGLLGRNGAGKSTLLHLIAGAQDPDGGVIERRQGLRTALLPQRLPGAWGGNVYETVAAGFQAQAGEPSGHRVEQLLTPLGLDPQAPVATLSGGMARRVLLARALISEPDILLLDEPTNHLDIDAIRWLEEFLKKTPLTLVFVTHDRAFLRALATRIVELERGRLFDFPGGYDAFQQHKEEWLHGEEQEWRRFDKKLAEEEIWIRQGIKARRTRNEGRVRALLKMREERRARRERLGPARFRLEEAAKSGRLVAELEGVGFGYGNRALIRDFSATVTRGDRIGIIGPNGVGKTTLLRLLLGELKPQSGSVRLGVNLQILYFDQLKEQLDPDKTVQQNLSGDHDTVIVGGKSRHVVGYLKDFLFTPDRIRTPVRILSGGERNRLLLARLFTRQANVLVLDEPTNDLDLETLDLLEELLAEFEGTLFLVSHDREFLNRTVTGVIAFEGEGKVAEYVGGYDDWLRQRPQPQITVAEKKPAREKPPKEKSRKLTFKEKRELKELPGRIEALEQEQAALHLSLADPAFYREAGGKVATAKNRLHELERELETAYGRWDELEKLQG